MKTTFFTFILLVSFNLKAEVTPCGLSGSIKERILDCESQKSKTEAPSGATAEVDTKSIYSLVTRTQEGDEIHKDYLNKILWSKIFLTKMNFHDAVSHCENYSDETKAYFKKVKWRLPSKQEIIQGLEKLPNFAPNGVSLWTSSESKGSYGRKSTDGLILKIENESEMKQVDKFSTKVEVRCVAD